MKHLFRLLFVLALLLAMVATPTRAQVSIPNTLAAGSVIRASDLNTNFTTVGNHALDRLSGGNIAGNVTVDSGITIDGIDIGATVCTTCGPTFKNLTLASPTTGLTVNSVNIVNSTGKIPDLSSTYFTAISASNFTTGTVPAARLGSGSPSSSNYLRGDNTWQAFTTLACAPTVTAQSGNYSAALCDLVEMTGTFTVTLPAASTATAGARNVIDVKNIGSGTVTVARAGSDTIDGATSYSLTTQYQSVTLVANAAGNGWLVR